MVYRTTHDRVLAYALSRTDPETAREVVSETFLVAWRRLDDVPDPALPWLLAVARNVLLHAWRSSGRRGALVEEIVRQTPDDAAFSRDVAEQVTERAVVADALGRLGERDREALTLVAWDGLSVAEAARVCGCSAATFSVRLHRARRRFASALEASSRAVPAAAVTRPALTVPRGQGR